MMDKISLQKESESLISCTCSIFINVRGSRSSIALQALGTLARPSLLDTNEAGRASLKGITFGTILQPIFDFWVWALMPHLGVQNT